MLQSSFVKLNSIQRNQIHGDSFRAFFFFPEKNSYAKEANKKGGKERWNIYVCLPDILYMCWASLIIHSKYSFIKFGAILVSGKIFIIYFFVQKYVCHDARTSPSFN